MSIKRQGPLAGTRQGLDGDGRAGHFRRRHIQSDDHCRSRYPGRREDSRPGLRHRKPRRQYRSFHARRWRRYLRRPHTAYAADRKTAGRTNSALGIMSFAAADMAALPFDDGQFDAITCRFGIMFPEDKVGGGPRSHAGSEARWDVSPISCGVPMRRIRLSMSHVVPSQNFSVPTRAPYPDAIV